MNTQNISSDTVPSSGLVPGSAAQRKRLKNLLALVIVLTGLFAGSLFVDFVQLALGRGFSQKAVKTYDLLEAGGKTWVAYDDPKVTVQVVTEAACAACDPKEALGWLRRVLPTLEAMPVESTSEQGKLLIERFRLVSLPAFIFSKNVVETDFYTQASSLFAQQDGRYFFDMGKIGLPAGRYLTLPRLEGTDSMLGPADAPIKIITFSDFTCLYCQTFHANLKQVLRKYEGQVLLVYKYLPLGLHPQAENAALAAACANEQGKFMGYADWLFSNQNQWKQTTGTRPFKDRALRQGLNTRQFAVCLDTRKYLSKIQGNQAEAKVFSLSGTPSTFVNDIFLSGAVSPEVLQQAIETQLTQSR